MSKPFSRAGVGYRLEALGVFVFFMNVATNHRVTVDTNGDDPDRPANLLERCWLPPLTGSVKYHRT
jgi:hypothetical protein